MLADINGKPLIVRCMECCMEADIAPVYVACDSEEIKSVVEAAGGQGVLTPPELPSGSDRVFAASEQLDAGFDVILNVQGDQPFINPQIVKDLIPALEGADISTPVTTLQPDEVQTDSVVKAIVAEDGRALYFTRAPIAHGFHHIGLYAYRKPALAKFVSLPPSNLEKLERLEQLRALEHGMTIKVSHAAESLIAIDTPADLERARKMVK